MGDGAQMRLEDAEIIIRVKPGQLAERLAVMAEAERKDASDLAIGLIESGVAAWRDLWMDRMRRVDAVLVTDSVPVQLDRPAVTSPNGSAIDDLPGYTPAPAKWGAARRQWLLGIVTAHDRVHPGVSNAELARKISTLGDVVSADAVSSTRRVLRSRGGDAARVEPTQQQRAGWARARQHRAVSRTALAKLIEQEDRSCPATDLELAMRIKMSRSYVRKWREKEGIKSAQDRLADYRKASGQA